MNDIVLTDDELEMIHELRHLREERKTIEARESELRNEILQRLDGADHAITASGDVAVKVTTQLRRGVERSKLEALFPDVFEQVVTESEVQIVTLP